MFSGVQTFTFNFFANTQTNQNVHNLVSNERYDCRPYDGDTNAPGLAGNLSQHVEVAYFVGNIVIHASAAQCWAYQHASAQCAEDPADAVHTEDVERVIIAHH